MAGDQSAARSVVENDDDVAAAIKGKRKMEDRLNAIIVNVPVPKRAY